MKKRFLRTAFVATVSASAPFAAGCDPTVLFGESDIISNPPPPPACPVAVPSSGDACGPDGLVCTYDDGCGKLIVATCGGEGWSVDFPGTCNPPPPPTCPDEIPGHAADCDAPGLFCSYEQGDGCPDIEATCLDDGWSVAWSSCNPPPPACPEELPEAGALCEEEPGSWGYPFGCQYTLDTPCGDTLVTASCEWSDAGEVRWEISADPCTIDPQDCEAYGTRTLCGLSGACRWLAPGCTDEGLSAPEGCYPAEPCADDGCYAGLACVEVVHDPCVGADCDACAAETSVCLPAPE